MRLRNYYLRPQAASPGLLITFLFATACDLAWFVAFVFRLRNIGNLSNEQNGLKPDDLNVSFALNYVPRLESTS